MAGMSPLIKREIVGIIEKLGDTPDRPGRTLNRAHSNKITFDIDPNNFIMVIINNT
jgi:hypothetical protein